MIRRPPRSTLFPYTTPSDLSAFAHLKALPLKIVIDCANGAVGAVLPEICEALNLNAQILYPEPDGNFPNHHPDPSEEKNLTDLKSALEGEFDIGFGFDGDGDRIAVLTKKRNIKGDELAYLYSLAMKNPRVLGEVKCSQNSREIGRASCRERV